MKKYKSTQEQLGDFNEALLDVFYEIGKSTGMIYLCKKFGLELKDWVKIRVKKEINK